jgi:Zn-dependent M28 family amino/carboxypeptidase
VGVVVHARLTRRAALCRGLIALGLLGAACTSTRPVADSEAAAPGAAAQSQIGAAVLAGPIRFLSSDLLEGRGPGTRGDQIARNYIAAEMETIGLLPGGPGGAWEQPIELIGLTTSLPARWEFRRAGRRVRLEPSADFVAATGVASARAGLEDAELVFVGYGIQAPEYAWDDFKGADLRGKVLVVLNNDPDWDPQLFAGPRRLYYGRWTYKYESAARQGAVGAIIIHTPPSASYPWQTVQTSWTGENSRLSDASDTALQIQAWVTEGAAERILALADQSLATLTAAARSRDFAPVALGITTSLHVTNTVRRYQTANVIGVLRGSDAPLADQAVIYTAHHDHLGTTVGPDGRRAIYNGALDNASGVAQLLAVARAFRAAGPTRRTVVFIAVAAEEQMLLGSQYYVSHPTVPHGKMVTSINFDGGNIWGRTRDVAVVGYGKSTLDRWVADAAARQGRVVVDERFPERGGFYRSDQFSFARAGVPVLFARSGIDYLGRPEGWGREQSDAWVAAHYHQPSDDFDATWNLDGMIEDARLLFEVGYALAQSADLPHWAPGDEFEAARARALAVP